MIIEFLVSLRFPACSVFFRGLCHCLNISCASKLIMSFRSSGSKHGSGAKFQKSAHEKKSKSHKQRGGAKYLQDETPQPTLKEVAEKTLASITRLGSQTFALSPFSQYYDDWLVNLRQVVSEFELNPNVNADDAFVKERERIFLDIEAALAEKRLQESSVTGEAKALHDVNHQLTDADRDYAEKTRELSNKRNVDVQHLSNRVRELEDDIAGQQEVKISVFKINARKAAAQKLEQTKQELNKTKNELEVTLQNFTVEQEKLHDNYEKIKQELTERIESLHKELEKLETDTSVDARQAACNALACAVNALIQRTPASSAN
jgi:DNA repair exonuclease SbcCD ATPase subunit